MKSNLIVSTEHNNHRHDDKQRRRRENDSERNNQLSLKNVIRLQRIGKDQSEKKQSIDKI